MRRMQTLAWLGAIMLFFTALGGCATKGYVNQNVTEVREEMDQMQTRLESQVAASEEAASAAVAKAESIESEIGGVRALAEGRTGFHEVSRHEVRFAFNSAHLDDAARAVMNHVVDLVSRNPQYVIDLYGFADPTGPAEYNDVLAQRRVNSVERYLLDRTADALHRYRSISFGEMTLASHVDGSSTNEERRRVAILLLQRTPAEERQELTER